MCQVHTENCLPVYVADRYKFIQYIRVATGFCSREILIEEDEDVTFDWPETAGGENATFICLNNATVIRCCATGGVWQDFDYGACSTG